MKIPQLTEDNKAAPVAVRLNAKHRETYKRLGGVKWLRYVLDLADKEFAESQNGKQAMRHLGVEG